MDRQCAAWGVVIAIAASLVAGCAHSAEDDTVTDLEGAAITGGSATNVAPVVLIHGQFEENGTLYQGTCSGTIIGRRTVLTAAHCLTHEGRHTAAELAALDKQHAMTVFEGQKPNRSAGGNAVVARFINPIVEKTVGTAPDGSSLVERNPAGQWDVAILHVAQPFTTPPVALTGGIMLQPGARIAQFGYGITDDKSLGAQRGTDMEIVSVMSPGAGFMLELQGIGGETCPGDSGGPTLAVNDVTKKLEVLGVLSYGQGTPDALAACKGTRSFAARVDMNASFIRSHLLD